MKPVGLSRDSGWMAGARKTFRISTAAAWEFLLSDKAVRVWLGGLPESKLAKRVDYRLADGTHGRVTVFEPGSHLRMTWTPPSYPRPSILQVRVMATGDKAVIAFHQEHLPDQAARAGRKAFFQQVLDQFEEMI